MPNVKLKSVSRSQGNNEALKTGRVSVPGFDLQFEEVPVLIDAFRRMVRGLEFDVCELALTTYICARAHGKRFTALPIFLVRAFHHGAILINSDAGIHHPKDLEGRRVGVNRGYTVTTGLWARSILQNQYGVDLSKITWVLSGDEHVAEYRPPANVVPIEVGQKMSDLLTSGDLCAAIGIESDAPNVRPLIPNADEVAYGQLAANGHYPINHLIVVRDEVLEQKPEVARALFDAFAQSKRQYLAKLQSDSIDKPTAVDAMHKRVSQITGNDPLPYGIEPNRRMVQEVIDSALVQGIITERVSVDSLFCPSLQGLTA